MTVDSLLVIPDSHAHPDHNNKRYDRLGKYILDVRPSIVVNLGDVSDMPSLCSYDYGKKGFEGRRYKKDIESTVDAQERLWHPLKKAKKKLPRRVQLIGNHEDRIDRAVESDAKLEGVMGMEDLEFEYFNDEVVPFLGVTVIEGVAFSHYFTSGTMNRAIGGVHPAYSLLTKQHMSCIQGHGHNRDFAEHTAADGSRILALVAGCYIDYHMEWAGPANELWWRGVVMLRGVSNGYFDHEWISLKAIEEAYS